MQGGRGECCWYKYLNLDLGQETGRGARASARLGEACWSKFSKVSTLVFFPQKVTIQKTFENSLPGDDIEV